MSGNTQEKHGLITYMTTPPPNLERVFGYDSYRRWVAFFWSRQEDTCLSFDGYAYTPISALAWDSFFSHQIIVALNHQRDAHGLMKLYEFGDMHAAARHWLVLDRQKKILFVGEKNNVLGLFRSLVHQESTDNTGMPGQAIWIAENTANGGTTAGRLELINGMIQWLDHQLKLLKESGKWPQMGD
jgi:hypothetical protein